METKLKLILGDILKAAGENISKIFEPLIDDINMEINQTKEGLIRYIYRFFRKQKGKLNQLQHTEKCNYDKDLEFLGNIHKELLDIYDQVSKQYNNDRDILNLQGDIENEIDEITSDKLFTFYDQCKSIGFETIDEALEKLNKLISIGEICKGRVKERQMKCDKTERSLGVISIKRTEVLEILSTIKKIQTKRQELDTTIKKSKGISL